MLFSVEQAFVGREEIRAPLKRPAWEAKSVRAGDESELPTRGSIYVILSLGRLSRKMEEKPSTKQQRASL